jgi:hypothetical protein
VGAVANLGQSRTHAWLGQVVAEALELKTKSGTESTAALMAAIRTRRNLDTVILLEMNGEGGYDDGVAESSGSSLPAERLAAQFFMSPQYALCAIEILRLQ